jgi:hypothetical protein
MKFQMELRAGEEFENDIVDSFYPYYVYPVVGAADDIEEVTYKGHRKILIITAVPLIFINLQEVLVEYDTVVLVV